MVRVGFHKGVVSLDEGGVWGFGVAEEGGRTGKEEKRRRRGKFLILF